jgi:hypothetical protein
MPLTVSPTRIRTNKHVSGPFAVDFAHGIGSFCQAVIPPLVCHMQTRAWSQRVLVTLGVAGDGTETLKVRYASFQAIFPNHPKTGVVPRPIGRQAQAVAAIVDLQAPANIR